MVIGPANLTHEARMAAAVEIAGMLKAHFGDRLIALALYGSLARAQGGPFSDIEMFCVLEGTGIEQTLEWCAGPWKAEISILSVNMILQQAASVEGDWPIVQTCYVFTEPLFDPTNLFIHVCKTALSQPESKFRAAIKAIIVEEIYERIGKIRNLQSGKHFSALASNFVYLARDAACLAGLSNRYLFNRKSAMLAEAITLPDLPDGLLQLCTLAAEGKLDQPDRLIAACENFWKGTIAWCEKHGIKLTSTLEELLMKSSVGK